MASINDLIAAKLIAEYGGVERTGSALLKRYRADNSLNDWSAYVAHVAGASTSANFNDDHWAFWTAYVP